MKLSGLVLALLFVPLPALANAPAQAASQLTGQDAVYNLTLSKLRTHDITGVTGRMQFQVVDGCTGWASYQHMVLMVRTVDGSLSKSINDYTTWESKDEKTFSFSMSQTNDDGKMQITDAGIATHTGPDNSGVVKFSVPAHTELMLPPGTLFPNQHTEALLQAAQQGKNFISPLLFDGTSTEGVSPTFITIFSHQGPDKTAWPELDKYASADVGIAFFPITNKDSSPEFSTSMRYFENGVATGLVLDFGDFIVNGTLSSLRIPKSACPVEK